MPDDADGYPTTVKNDDSTDWSFEGPGQRVGYDDLTAIDWIFEYTKERQRLRALLSNTSGLVGYVRQLLDASQIWTVLIGTGIAAGIIAACIDIASDWLGDLKTGYCRNGPTGGKFYLNRGFCCWGLEGKNLGELQTSSCFGFLTALSLCFEPVYVHKDSLNIEADYLEWSQCLDWTPWGSALGAHSKAGRYTVEFIFYLMFSVRITERVTTRILDFL